MSKENKLIKRNIELSTEFSRYIFEHPDIEKMIPIGSEIILLPEYDKELKEFNLKLGKEIETEGEKVVYIKIMDIRPKTLSRIEKVELASVV